MSEAFNEYMTEKYGGVIVAPKGGFSTDDLYDAWLAGRDAETERLAKGGSFK